jgi:hypothetical protein
MEPQRAQRELQLAELERELEQASLRLITLRRDMEHEFNSRDPAATARYGSIVQETTVLRQRIAHLHAQLGDDNALARVRRQRSIQARHENSSVDAALDGMDADPERAALFAEFARQNDRLIELNALASQDDLTPQQRSALLRER